MGFCVNKLGNCLVLFATLVICGAPLGAAAQTAPIFVLNSLDASVSVIDPVSWKEARRIPTGKTWRSAIEDGIRDMRCMVVL